MTDEELIEAMFLAYERAGGFPVGSRCGIAAALYAAKPLIAAEAREKALREAAQTVRAVPENPLFDTEEGTASRICGFAADTILALIREPLK